MYNIELFCRRTAPVPDFFGFASLIATRPFFIIAWDKFWNSKKKLEKKSCQIQRFYNNNNNLDLGTGGPLF